MDRFVPRDDEFFALTPCPFIATRAAQSAIAGRPVESVIARRTAPWQSMSSQERPMDRFVPRDDCIAVAHTFTRYVQRAQMCQ